MLLLTEINRQNCPMEDERPLSSALVIEPFQGERYPEMPTLTFIFGLYFSLSAAFYFHAGEREEKCIIEDIPSDTLLTGG